MSRINFFKSRHAAYVLILLVAISVLTVCGTSCATASPRQKYLAADSCYKKLRHSNTRQKYRHHWVKCIDKYQDIFKKHPESGWAPAGMYRSAQLYLKLYSHSYTPEDRQEGIDLLRRIQKRYPESAYSKRASNLLKKIDIRETRQKPIELKKALKQRTITDKPPDTVYKERYFNKTEAKRTEKNKNRTAETADSSSENTGDDTLVTGLRFWSNPEYTRVVIDAKSERVYKHRFLKRDPSINVHFKRLYVDIENARLGENVPSHTPIEDDLLKQARAGQHTRHSVRVVVDIKSFENYKIFSLKDPFRIVMDIWGESTEKVRGKAASIGKDRTEVLSTRNLKSSDITRQLALGVATIVIDPGHGGSDPGCPGYCKGVWEKDITLELSKKLAKKLRDSLKCNVLLTRSEDRYLSLEERTAIANTKKADLFISLHCNGADNKRLRGFETYFLNLATDERAITVAAKENATSRKNISDLETILNDLMKNAKIKESSRLAENVQDSLVQGLKNRYSRINNLGVKQAPFYVLIGARMPSILIEASFLSNKLECERMMDEKYKDLICDSISNGIRKYIRETNPQFL